MRDLFKYHSTELLIGVSGTLSALAVGGVLSPALAAKFGVAAAVLGVWRGVIESVAKEHRK
jgi:hypothetical protein